LQMDWRIMDWSWVSRLFWINAMILLINFI